MLLTVDELTRPEHVVGSAQINLISMMFYGVNNLPQYCFNRRNNVVLTCLNKVVFLSGFPPLFPGGGIYLFIIKYINVAL